MTEAKLSEITGMKEEVIIKACSAAMKAHRSPEKQFLVEKMNNSNNYSPSSNSRLILISFPAGSSSSSNYSWFPSSSDDENKCFGETQVDPEIFPSLRSIGNNEVALVNQAFLHRFGQVLDKLKLEVEKLMKEKKQMVFTGHSLGAPIAILATIWCLEEQRKSKAKHDPPLCLTFGSPLIGNFIFSHALRREKWSRHFVNFVTSRDIIPLILLSPPSSLEQFRSIFEFLTPRSAFSGPEPVIETEQALMFFTTVMSNAANVASHEACNLMGNANLLLDTITTSFVNLSPYRPFGSYIFCNPGNKTVVVTNPNAILQVLFFSSQLGSETEVRTDSYNSLKNHWSYESQLREILEAKGMIHLEELEKLPLSSDDQVGRNATILAATDDLSLGLRARINLHAVGVMEKITNNNEDRIDKKRKEIEKLLTWLEKDYQDESKSLGCYDAFKLQNKEEDFKANMTRLDLAIIWDDIIEMLRQYKLPDGFEAREEWINLGTRLRRILEPLDIANFYRHGKNKESGSYLGKRGRPRRYKYTQRWREHGLKMVRPCNESTFWAEVEELKIETGNRKTLDGEIRNKVLELEEKVKRWYEAEEIGKDVFLKDSSFITWLRELPPHQSCIEDILQKM